MTTKIHNKSLGTDSLSEARTRRDAILLQLTKSKQQNESPQYAALIEKYQGASREELKEKLEDQGELLSEDFNYIGHQEYKGGLEEPTQSEILEYESLQVLSGNKNKNIIKAKYEEGCLSVPNQFAEIERPNSCEVEYLDYDGKKQLLKADGLLATCIQHEMDHLEGILFIDYLSKLKKSMILKKLSKSNSTRIIV